VLPAAAIDLARAEAIKGWMSPAELQWLATHALSARTIIEIGSFCGRSTRALADHCPGVVYAIDPWEGYCNDDGTQATWILKQGPGSGIAIAEAFRRNLADHLTSGRVVALPHRSEEARAILRDQYHVVRADLVFIDGDHRYDACRQDIELYQDLVRPGGILSGHDYNHATWPGVAKAVDDVVGPIERCGTLWWVTR
jgi:predicted O-methyltransferase YrrM